MKKVTLILVLIACSLFLPACNDLSSADALKGVINKYGSEVVPVPGLHYKFIVRKPNGEVWVVECMNNFDDKISAETLIFPATK